MKRRWTILLTMFLVFVVALPAVAITLSDASSHNGDACLVHTKIHSDQFNYSPSGGYTLQWGHKSQFEIYYPLPYGREKITTYTRKWWDNGYVEGWKYHSNYYSGGVIYVGSCGGIG